MLDVEEVHTFYGMSHILQGISFTVPEGQCIGLLGRNGAGKTTTIHTISGQIPSHKGKISYAGKEIQNHPSYKISRMGIGLVPQGRRIFPSLSVYENLTMAAYQGDFSNEEWNIDKIYEWFPVLKEKEKSFGTQLSGGQQQMLAIGRALMTNPRLLLMDEPSEGLAPVVIKQVRDIVQKIKRTGLSILMVEQNISLACETADRILIMNKGTIVWEGEPQKLMNNKDIQRQYLGV